MSLPVKIENRIYYSRSDIEFMIAIEQGVIDPTVEDFEVEWYDDHSAVIVLPDESPAPTRGEREGEVP